MKLENFKIYQPYGNVVVDVFKHTTDGKTQYNSGVTYFFDDQAKTGLTLLTDVHTDTSKECLEITLRSIGNIYSMISAHCGVYDADSGELIDELNLNELYPDGFAVTIPDEEDPTSLLVASPSNVYLH